MMVFLTLAFQPVSSQLNIARTGCGSTKFCLEEPTDCDPAANSICLFGSSRPTAVNPPNGVDAAFELSGNSSGYIAVGLAQNGTQDIAMLFVCGQNSSSNGTFLFRTMSLINSTLQELNRTVENLKNSTDGENIKCTFDVANLNATTMNMNRASADTTYVMVIGSGDLIGDQLGPFQVANRSLIDLASLLPNSTNTTTTPSGASPPLYSNAVLPLLSFLTMSILKFA